MAEGGVKMEEREATQDQVMQTDSTKEDQIGRTFSGLKTEDIEEFVEYVEAVKEANGWGNAKTAKRVKIKLLGEALLYVRVRRKQGVTLDVWDSDSTHVDKKLTLKHSLLERFSRELSATDIANLLLDCRQATDESVASFYYRVLRVVQKKNEEITEEATFIRQCDRDHLFVFLNGIYPEVRTAILGVASPPKNSSEALTAARNFEQQKAALKKNGANAVSTNAVSNRGGQNFRGRGGRRGNRPGGRSVSGSGSWYNKQMESLRARCWECGLEGHYRNQCRRLGGSCQEPRPENNGRGFRSQPGRGHVAGIAHDAHIQKENLLGDENKGMGSDVIWEEQDCQNLSKETAGNTQFFQ